MKRHRRSAPPSRPPGALPRTALALALLGLPACSPSTDLVERGIEGELQRVVGPAEAYDVEIEGLRGGDGEADRVTALGERVRLEGAPTVDHIELELLDVRYDRERERLESIGSARARATITASDLAGFLEQQGSVEDADVRLEEPDRVLARLRPDLGGLPLPPGLVVEIAGRVLGSGSHIRFEIAQVDAAGFPFGDELAGSLSRLINPLVDLSEMPIAFEVTAVRVADGELELEAVGDSTSLRF